VPSDDSKRHRLGRGDQDTGDDRQDLRGRCDPRAGGERIAQGERLMVTAAAVRLVVGRRMAAVM